MQLNNFKILVFVFSLIALILARETKIIDDISENVSEIVLHKTYQVQPRAPPLEVEFDITDEDTFRQSIERLRKTVSSLTVVPNMRTINPGEGDSLTLITFNVRGKQVQLVMRNENLYVVGFIIDQQFYRFADESFRNINVEGTTVVRNFNMEGSYTYLTGKWGQPLENLSIGPQNIESSVFDLINYHNNPSIGYQRLAVAMLRLILLTSESIRFNAIETSIVSSYQNYVDFVLGESTNLLRNWETFSTYGNGLVSDPRSINTHDTLGVEVGAERLTEVNRSTLWLLLAVALCGKSGPRNYDMDQHHYYSKGIDQCDDRPGDDVILINNKYWFKVRLVATIL
ncbi:hypothetical protein HA402_001616 [Bradysia odoriphaga]|nr:hypothetical protein HA402_001616 [Bradysia odoriphaga]